MGLEFELTLRFKVLDFRYNSAGCLNGILQHIVGHIISELDLE